MLKYKQSGFLRVGSCVLLACPSNCLNTLYFLEHCEVSGPAWFGFVYLFPPPLESAVSPKSRTCFSGEIFSNQYRCAHGYQGVIASRPSPSAEIENINMYMHTLMCTCVYTRTHPPLSVSISVSILIAIYIYLCVCMYRYKIMCVLWPSIGMTSKSNSTE